MKFGGEEDKIAVDEKRLTAAAYQVLIRSRSFGLCNFGKHRC